LRHYIQVLADGADVRLDGDCLTELDCLVDCLVDAAKDELRAEDQDTADPYSNDDLPGEGEPGIPFYGVGARLGETGA
jgi:hypothetical protein